MRVSRFERVRRSSAKGATRGSASHRASAGTAATGIDRRQGLQARSRLCDSSPWQDEQTLHIPSVSRHLWALRLGLE